MKGMISPLPRISLVTAFGKKAKRAAKQYEVDLKGKAGLAFYVEDKDGYTFVMLVRKCGDYESAMSVIAHESYHLACRYFECMGDDSPSEECMAYVTDGIAYEAMRRYRRWIDARRR